MGAASHYPEKPVFLILAMFTALFDVRVEFRPYTSTNRK